MPQKIKLIAVGKIKDRSISSLIEEFQKRLSPFCALEIIELKDEGLEKESLKIANHLGASTYLLDESGKMLSSAEFASLLKNTETPLTFIIGGPDGISGQLKSKARLLSLSRMTFTHEMARLFLIEQLYRAGMINSGRGYYQK
jgi:23S rRNA (pseudouridine1915-N3)-methyltransferase